MKTTAPWIEFFLKEVPKEITQTRFEHCLRVAKYAENLSKRNGYDSPDLAFLVGITHDITKQKKKEFHLGLLQNFGGMNLNEIPEAAYHAFSAPLYLKSKYGFENEEVTLAIQSHTLGGTNMTLLQKIIYASDFLGSEYALREDMLDEWITETQKNLNYGIYLKAMKTLNQLIENKNRIYNTTLETYNQIILEL